MTRAIRRPGGTARDDQWFCHEAIEAESVDLQVGGVGHGGEQVHLQVVHAVGGDG